MSEEENKEKNKADTKSELIDSKTPVDKSTPEDFDNIPAFGAWLRAQRDSKGISLEEIAAVTKIHIVQLQNIEGDKLDTLPSLAFVRGFLVNYARHIGLDENTVLERFKKEKEIDHTAPTFIKRRGATPTTQPKVRVVQAPQLKKAPGAKGRAPAKLPFTKKHIIAASVVLLLVVTLSMLVSLGKNTEVQTPETAGPQQIPEEQTPPQESEIAKVTTTVENKATPKEVKAPVVEKKPPPVVEAKKPEEVAEAKPEKKPEPAIVSTSTLEVRGLEASWVKIRVDNKDPEGFQLDKGKSNRYTVRDKVILSLSNAGAVEIRWNNQWYQPPGFRGDVKSVSLPAQLKSLKEK